MTVIKLNRMKNSRVSGLLGADVVDHQAKDENFYM